MKWNISEQCKLHWERAMKNSWMGQVCYMSKQLGLGRLKGLCSFCDTRVEETMPVRFGEEWLHPYILDRSVNSWPRLAVIRILPIMETRKGKDRMNLWNMDKGGTKTLTTSRETVTTRQEGPMTILACATAKRFQQWSKLEKPQLQKRGRKSNWTFNPHSSDERNPIFRSYTGIPS